MERDGLFAGDDPFEIARGWLAEAEKSEMNDPNAVALSTVDADGLPNVRMVLLKEISEDGFIFYTNYNSAKGRELTANPKRARMPIMPRARSRAVLGPGHRSNRSRSTAGRP